MAQIEAEQRVREFVREVDCYLVSFACNQRFAELEGNDFIFQAVKDLIRCNCVTEAVQCCQFDLTQFNVRTNVQDNDARLLTHLQVDCDVTLTGFCREIRMQEDVIQLRYNPCRQSARIAVLKEEGEVYFWCVCGTDDKAENNGSVRIRFVE